MTSQLQYFETNHRMSQVVKLNQYVETSGIVASEDAIGIAAQTQSVLDQLEQRLRLAGADRNQLVKMQIWITDMADFAEMNRVYEQWFEGYNKPARACVGAQLADPHYLIEIQASAVLTG
ncbi:RidA family protein [Acinetobacter pseudolwoffii]|uniref:RidA family protein n=1 Tax=Acinetobacter pseudolwoffii TaxID=2053287 RepID=UPI002574C596|nr:RidA family protein [Acinetobacter pseudolwoffii]MDM1341493.1 RidA family protein [Acinetobacter pseudolwoffii]